MIPNSVIKKNFFGITSVHLNEIRKILIKRDITQSEYRALSSLLASLISKLTAFKSYVDSRSL